MTTREHLKMAPLESEPLNLYIEVQNILLEIVPREALHEIPPRGDFYGEPYEIPPSI